jgi:hypothetical protein
MTKTVASSLLEKISVLIILGILAGAVGGLGIGLITMKTSTPTAAR